MFQQFDAIPVITATVRVIIRHLAGKMNTETANATFCHGGIRIRLGQAEGIERNAVVFNPEGEPTACFKDRNLHCTGSPFGIAIGYDVLNDFLENKIHLKTERGIPALSISKIADGLS